MDAPKEKGHHALPPNADRSRVSRGAWLFLDSVQLGESSIWDARLRDLGADLNDLVLCYGEHRGDTLLRESIASQYGVAACDVLVAPGAAAGLFLVNTALLGLQSSIVVVR